MRFAWRQVVHDATRSAIAAAGVGFAILVLFVQLGFYNAVVNTAVAVTERLDADLLLVSPRFVHLSDAGHVDRGRLFQALAVPEVESARPLYFRYADWRDPVTRQGCRLFAIGIPIVGEARLPIRVDGLPALQRRLRPSDAVLLDRLTQDKCGPSGDDGTAEVRNQVVRVVGGFELGVGFLADGSLIVSDQTFSRLFGGYPLEEPHLGLLHLRDGADPEAAAGALRDLLPPDTLVLRPEQLEERQVDHWVWNTAAGNIFALGAGAGFLVGLVILYQILSTDIRNHLPQYATLKAMGYGDRRLVRFVLQKAWIFAALGFLPAVALTAALFPFVHGATRLPVFLTLPLGLFVGIAALSMSAAAALLSSGRLRRADPAELF